MELKIRQMRQARRLTQKEIARHLHCDQSLYSKYERGEREIPLHLLVELAFFYGVSLDYLAGLTPQPKPYI